MLTLNKQSGVALFLSLLLLLVMTMIGVGAMHSINMEERMAGNLKRMADAHMTAEAGVKRFYEWLNEDIDNRWDSAEWQEQTYIPTSSDSQSGQYGDYGYYWLEEWVRSGDEGTLLVRGEARALGNTLSNVGLEATFTQKTKEDCNLNQEARDFIGPALSVLDPEVEFPACGIVTDDQVLLNGETHLRNASLHSNADIDESVFVSGEDSTITGGEVTAVGAAQVPESWWEQDVVTDGVNPWDIPPITAEMFDAWRLMADEVRTDCGTESDPWEISGDQGGAQIFCEGDAWIEGKFNNINLFVAGDPANNIPGNLVHGGALKGEGFEGGLPTNFFAVNGDITFNGSSGSEQQAFDGIFWSNGTFRQNGKGYFHGAVIAAEAALAEGTSDAVFNGTLEYDGLKNQDFFGEPRRLAIIGWRQLSN